MDENKLPINNSIYLLCPLARTLYLRLVQLYRWDQDPYPSDISKTPFLWNVLLSLEHVMGEK